MMGGRVGDGRGFSPAGVERGGSEVGRSTSEYVTRTDPWVQEA